MQTVWKYVLPIQDEVISLAMPEGAVPLCIDMQGPNLCLWARVDPSEQDKLQTFRVVGTGHPAVEPRYQYIGSAKDGIFVRHVFRVLAEEAARRLEKQSQLGASLTMRAREETHDRP